MASSSGVAASVNTRSRMVSPGLTLWMAGGVEKMFISPSFLISMNYAVQPVPVTSSLYASPSPEFTSSFTLSGSGSPGLEKYCLRPGMAFTGFRLASGTLLCSGNSHCASSLLRVLLQMLMNVSTMVITAHIGEIQFRKCSISPFSPYEKNAAGATAAVTKESR